MSRTNFSKYTEEYFEGFSTKETFHRRSQKVSDKISKETLQDKAGGKHRQEISWEYEEETSKE